MRTTAALSAIAAGLATTALAATIATAPAHAESIGAKDPRDTSHGSDLRAVQVRHQDRAVVVVTNHVNLRRDPASGSGGLVYLDTDPSDRGPEYVFVGGYFAGTDYSLLETEGFGAEKMGDVVDGRWSMKVDYRNDRVRFRVARAAIGDPEQVRVAVRVSGTRTDGSSAGLVDWLGKAHSFTDWVSQG